MCRKVWLAVLISTAIPLSGESFSTPSSSRTSILASSTRSSRIYINNDSLLTLKPIHSIARKSRKALLKESLRDRDGNTGKTTAKTTATKSQQRGWHRRLLSKLVLRRRSSSAADSSSTATTPLHMTVMDEETEALLESIALYEDNKDFLVRNFEANSPDTVLPEIDILPSTKRKTRHDDNDNTKPKTAFDTSSAIIDSEFYDVTITSPSTKTHPTTNPPKEVFKRSLSLPRLLGMLVENILTSRIIQHTIDHPENLSINVQPLDNTLSRLLLRGQMKSDVKISAGRLVFPPIRFSSGKVELEQVTLNLLGFLQQQQQHTKVHEKATKKVSDRGGIRYPKQFDLHIEDLTMSRHDLLFSPCVKNGLRRLLVNILRDRGIRSSSIQISSIDILSSGKISCTGEARTHFGSAPLPFEVRSGVSFASQGHVLTFPGLEVSLNRDIGFFVPVVPVIDLDVGHNARFRRIVIDGKKKQIKLDASVTITPDRTIRLMQNYVQSSEAFSARFSYDVGRWLTRLGNFSK